MKIEAVGTMNGVYPSPVQGNAWAELVEAIRQSTHTEVTFTVASIYINGVLKTRKNRLEATYYVAYNRWFLYETSPYQHKGDRRNTQGKGIGTLQAIFQEYADKESGLTVHATVEGQTLNILILGDENENI
jgi:hypothetical protein